MAALHFEMEDIEDVEVTKITFNVLRDFLQPDSATTLESAARPLLDLSPSKKLHNSGELHAFNTIIIALAEKVPYYHPSQHKFAALMEHLDGTAKLNESSPNSCGGSRVNWIGMQLREAWNGMFRASGMLRYGVDSCLVSKDQLLITRWPL